LSPPPTVGKAPPPKPPIRVDERYIEYLDQPSPDVFAFVPPLEERTPPGGAGVATEKSASLTGVVIPLKDRRTAFATHVLVRLDGRKAIPLCYLRTRLFPLDEWNYHDVRVYGRQIDYPGWQRPVLELNGIQLTNPE